MTLKRLYGLTVGDYEKYDALYDSNMKIIKKYHVKNLCNMEKNIPSLTILQFKTMRNNH